MAGNFSNGFITVYRINLDNKSGGGGLASNSAIQHLMGQLQSHPEQTTKNLTWNAVKKCPRRIPVTLQIYHVILMSGNYSGHDECHNLNKCV